MDDQKTINVLKGLVIDAVHEANAGHPGGAMSSMDFAYVLFSEFLKFDPDDAQWVGRDRFILSAGHESMLLYSLLHMNGWLPMDELKRFRQLHSKTPGHPENYLTPGVECTTGPLGQGAAMSVGFAIAATHLKANLDKDLFEQNIYALLGDGCMQEDITLGAASLAGHLKLSKLIWYYDKNRAQISGNISRVTSDDEQKIFSGFGWNVIEIDGHDRNAIRSALKNCETSEKPTLIIGNTIMAQGAFSLEGSHKTHGAPLPAEEREKTREKMGLGKDSFDCPKEAVSHYQRNFAAKRSEAASWRDALAKKLEANNEFSKQYHLAFGGDELPNLSDVTWPAGKPVATRNAFGDIIAQWAEELPHLMGGSADLEPSNMTGAFAKKVGDFCAGDYAGRNIAFGVREFPMSAICNGMALHGGVIPFDATFLSFADYSRAALRLGAIQKVRVIHEFTHDSFYLGEDGPTHQAVEHVMSLRLIPDFYVMRPADAYETEIMMRSALKLNTQSAICLSRQKLPLLGFDKGKYQEAAKGAYVVQEGKSCEYVFFATGSEVSLALATAEKIGKDKVKVVSMPCWELFNEQSNDYQKQILSPEIKKRVSIEAGVASGWQQFTGNGGLNISFDRFGDSAPASDLEKEYGFTPEAVCAKIEAHDFY